MKKSLILILIGLGVALAIAKTPTVVKSEVVVPCTCPTLEQLLAQQAAKEKQDRIDRATARRQLIKDKIGWVILN